MQIAASKSARKSLNCAFFHTFRKLCIMAGFYKFCIMAGFLSTVTPTLGCGKVLGPFGIKDTQFHKITRIYLFIIGN